jgi:hypothetical protein
MELRTLERLLDLLCTSCCQLIFLKKGWVVLDLIHAVHAQVVRGIAHSQAGQDRARTGQDLVKEGGVLRHVPDTYTRTVLLDLCLHEPPVDLLE